MADALIFRGELFVEDTPDRHPDGASPNRYLITEGKSFVRADPTTDNDDSGPKFKFELNNSLNGFIHEDSDRQLDSGLIERRRLRGVTETLIPGQTIVIPESSQCTAAELLASGDPPANAWHYDPSVLAMVKYTRLPVRPSGLIPSNVPQSPSAAAAELHPQVYIINGGARFFYVLPWFVEIEEEYLGA